MGGAVFPFIYLVPNYGGGNEDNGDLLQKVPCTHTTTLEWQLHSSGAAAAGFWRDFEELPHVQVQRSTRKTVGRAKSPLESNPTPTRDAQRAQKNLCTPGPRDPTETETELCLSDSCRVTGQQWTATRAGALGKADLGMV